MFMKLGKDKLLCFIFFACMYLGYILIQKILTTANVLTIPFIDNNIPLVSWFAIPYLSMYFITLLPFLFTWNDKKKLFATSFTFLYAAAIAHAIFLIYPTMMVRPTLIPLNSFDYLVEYIYLIDPPINAFPSLHVLYSALAYLCLRRINKSIALLALPFSSLTIVSTVLIKQHFFIDVVGGLALSFFAYKTIFLRTLRKK